MTLQSTLLSWAALVALGAGGYWYYFQHRQGRRSDYRRNGPVENDAILRRHREGSSKRGRDRNSRAREIEIRTNDVALSPSQESSANRSKQRKQVWRDRMGNEASRSTSGKRNPEPEATSLGHDASAKDHQDDAISNAELARRMQTAKVGTTLSSPEKMEKRARTVKQSQLNGKDRSPAKDLVLSAASSADTGPELDDDTSSSGSHAPSATTPPIDSTGVLDMLATPQSKLAVLRVTDPVEPVRPAPSKSKAVGSAPLTKKQRQRHAKNEARKAEAREREKERQQRMEAHMRVAREAAGDSAARTADWKHGDGPAPTKWSHKSPKNSSESVRSTNAWLLDTFEGPENESPVRSGHGLRNESGEFIDTPEDLADSGRREGVDEANKPNTNSSPTTSWGQGFVSEEEQLRMIEEQRQNEQWTTVAAKKSSRKAKTQTNEVPEGK